METSELLSMIETLHADARRRGLFFQTCDDVELSGRRIRLNGRDLLSFGSCGYLGLESHPALIEGSIELTRRYGTQFASSRGYLSAPPYEEFEETLSRIFGAHALTVQTTTLAHQAAFDTFLTEKDAIVLDHQVHYSVQRAATLARAAGARVEIVRHEHLERAEELIARLAREHRTVWFATDGITSMYGDLAPVGLLQRLLAIADNVRLYVDDAHGMSWCGEHGRGSILSRMELHPRMVVATSLAKAFAGGGAALVFADREECERVRMCGGPCVFSGPLQPPLLGAALASARLHVSDELPPLQRELAERVAYTNRRMVEAGLPLLVENETPIMFVRCGLPRVAAEMAERLAKDGLYVNVSMYPAVPMRRAGLRIGITRSHSLEDIDRLIDGLSKHVPAVLAQEGVRLADLDDLFAESVVRDRAPIAEKTFLAAIVEHAPVDVVLPRSAAGRALAATAHQRRVREERESLTLTHSETIRAIDRAEWDGALGSVGCVSWDAMDLAERAFDHTQRRIEHRWDFDYLVVRDAAGRAVAMTSLCTALQKDDMLMRAKISEAVERLRERDPYFLTSRVTLTGSNLSEGRHLWVDPSGPWRGALSMLLEKAVEVQETRGADALVLRELPGDDAELDGFLLEEGFVKMPALDTHLVDLDGSEEEMIARLSPRSRRLARQVIADGAMYRVEMHDRDRPAAGLAASLHRLYASVASRNRRMNTFELPESLIETLLQSPAWEIGTLRIVPAQGGPADGTPVGFWAAHRHADHYAPLFCGLDPRYIESHRLYKQCLRQVIERARQVGARTVHLGMDAELEKRRWGARACRSAVFVQARAEYNGALLREIVSSVGLQAA
ncbi:MAG: bifunctional aminotransferase class I/II-fold pyridoxal phosphate-dependent enzyme/GNAT family N-acetyltransferase [Myxococcota bacterium]|nr:bifunctional aminotransferase class I/II-fold pyridoxal phosphate-dependent enzyme/GNAT family N-acetyltransferase [Myxococcota bacterium]